VGQIRGVIVPCGAACVLGVVFAAPWFFTLVYAEAFHDAAWIAPLACVAAWFAILNSPTNRALLALAETRALAVAGAIKVLLTGAGCAAGYYYLSPYGMGVGGFVMGVALGAAGEHACNLVTLRRHGIHLVLADAAATLALAALALAGWHAPRAVGLLMPATPALVLGLLVQGALVALAALLALRRVLPLLKGRKKP
jgi:O-antigen/teichoic acid export membrane protein